MVNIRPHVGRGVLYFPGNTINRASGPRLRNNVPAYAWRQDQALSPRSNWQVALIPHSRRLIPSRPKICHTGSLKFPPARAATVGESLARQQPHFEHRALFLVLSGFHEHANIPNTGRRGRELRSCLSYDTMGFPTQFPQKHAVGTRVPGFNASLASHPSFVSTSVRRTIDTFPL
jgi:hypothetical protein